MRVENRLVPFPERDIHSAYGQLEGYLLDLLYREQEIIRYKYLPSIISSVGVDQYANWLEELTAEDKQKRERGAIIHLRHATRSLIYPKNPFLGENTEVVIPLSSSKKAFDKNYPIMTVHSHPESSGPSMRDIASFLVETPAVGTAISTSQYNYLFFTTYETPSIDSDILEQQIRDLENTIENTVKSNEEKIRSYINPKCPPDVKEILEYMLLNYVADAELEAFDGSSFQQYYYSYAAAYHLAQEYKLGFYYSKKNGLYKPVPSEWNLEIRLKYETAVQQGLDKLNTFLEKN